MDRRGKLSIINYPFYALRPGLEEKVRRMSKLDTMPKEDYLYLHLFFLNVGGDLLPVTAYYVLRGNAVFQINSETFEETPTGDNPAELINCKSLGKYSPKKVKPYHFDYIDTKKMISLLSQAGTKGDN